MRILVIVISSILIFVTCKKGIEHDKQYLRGRVFITDTLTSSKKEVPINKTIKVFLAKKNDSLNFIYYTYTDKEGYFVFDLLSNKDDDYTVTAVDTIAAGNVKYFFKGQTAAKRGEKDLAVLIKLDEGTQNGFILNTQDPLLEKLPATRLYIYNNSSIAAINDSANAVFKLWSDSNGMTYRLNLSSGDYYINAIKAIDTLTYQRLGKKIRVEEKGVTTDTIILTKKAAQNGIVMMVRDSANSLVPAAEVRLYTSLVFALADNDAGSIASLVSDSIAGKITKINLSAGTYYLNARKTNGADIFSRVAKLISLPASGFITDTVVLTRKTPVYKNSIIVEAKDEFGGIFPKAKFFLFNSKLLADANETQSAIAMEDGDNYGVVRFNNLPAGQYFINAIKKLNDTTIYERISKTIVLPASGQVTDTIILRKKTNTYNNGISIEARDSLNGSFPKTSFYLFNSQVLAASSLQAGSIDTKTGDNNGKANFYDLPAGTYFINASKAINDTIVYERLVKTMIVPASGIISDTLILLRKIK